jgi:hypothetical protein
MIQVRTPDDIPQYVRHCTIQGAALYGVDFPIETKAVRYPLVVYLHSPYKYGSQPAGVQAYGTATRVTSAPSPVNPANSDLVPQFVRGTPRRTWFHFDQILNVNPSVPHTEFFTVMHEPLESVPADTLVLLGPPYPVKKK